VVITVSHFRQVKVSSFRLPSFDLLPTIAIPQRGQFCIGERG